MLPCGSAGGWCAANYTCFAGTKCLPPGAVLCDGFGSFCSEGSTCDARVACLAPGGTVCSAAGSTFYYACPAYHACGVYSNACVDLVMGGAVAVAVLFCLAALVCALSCARSRSRSRSRSAADAAASQNVVLPKEGGAVRVDEPALVYDGDLV